ncbi:MAG: DUF2461 domain-containing protein [Planctomycetota bacterium]|jgi:uncharacterized protein (TIGR02453 family)
MKPTFQGFSKDAVRFLRRLAANNRRGWLEDHQEEFDALLLAPARQLVWELGQRLSRLVPGLIADPRAHGLGSISRMRRDTRFANDKSPYRTHLGILFWQGRLAGKWQNPGFHLTLSADELILTGGLRTFQKPMLTSYRLALLDNRRRRELRQAVTKATAKGCELGGRTYKRVPRGLDTPAGVEDLLCHSGLFVSHGEKPAVAHTAELVPHCAGLFRDMVPVVRWLGKITEQVAVGVETAR